MKMRIYHAAIAGTLLALLAIEAQDTEPKVVSVPGTKVLLLTGGHGFEREPFLKVFTDNTNITLTTAEHAKGTASAWEREDLDRFDVVVLYDMPPTINHSRNYEKANQPS